MATTTYRKRRKDDKRRMSLPVMIFAAILPRRLQSLANTLGNTFMSIFVMTAAIAVIGVPYAAAIIFITKLKIFPFPLVGGIIAVVHTIFLVRHFIIANIRERLLGRAEKKYMLKSWSKAIKEGRKTAKKLDEMGSYTNTEYLDMSNMHLYMIDLNEDDHYMSILKRATSPVAWRSTGGAPDTAEPIIARYRAQIRYAHRPDYFKVYYTDTYGSEDAERCLRQFLEDTRDMVITDCTKDDEPTVTGLEHEVYIDFFSGNSHRAVRCYTAEGTVNYDYDYAGAEA